MSGVRPQRHTEEIGAPGRGEASLFAIKVARPEFEIDCAKGMRLRDGGICMHAFAWGNRARVSARNKTGLGLDQFNKIFKALDWS